ncbi:agamous-like MADS-box protein AGL82 [Prunus yedoensis var. nudiflora]|uniref:Agamous-like MADS-box protein AGL82 n=1 Tax=Prunus yedoensis var. nudiflora TaxID=2094558 RepID=A0A314YUS4_PRUYE|nr:agamous-like MADS-box protein AGL82 [Prunus yedoensis var. nudiflora]
MPPRATRSLELIPNKIAPKMTFRKRKKTDQKNRRAIQLETWPQDSAEFNRIFNKYKASKDIHVPGLKQNFDLSDFYNAAEKEDVDRKFEKLYPTWDDRIDEFSQVELIKLICSLEAKLQASSKKIDSMEQNRNVSKAEEHHTNMCWKPTKLLIKSLISKLVLNSVPLI